MHLPDKAGLEWKPPILMSFLYKTYSISGILDNLDKLSPKELKCACCLFGVALQKACKKKRRW